MQAYTPRSRKHRKLGGRVVDAFKNRRFQGFTGFPGISGEILVNLVTCPFIVPIWTNTYFELLQIQEISIFISFDFVAEVKKLMFLALYSLKIFRLFQISTLSRSWCGSQKLLRVMSSFQFLDENEPIHHPLCMYAFAQQGRHSGLN